MPKTTYGPGNCYARYTNKGPGDFEPPCHEDGPTCPECDHEDCTVVSEDKWAGEYECPECGHSWDVESAAMGAAMDAYLDRY